VPVDHLVMFIPERLKWLGRHKAGAKWLANLPDVVSELARAWAFTWELRTMGQRFLRGAGCPWNRSIGAESAVAP
jgi:hypothetical protein